MRVGMIAAALGLTLLMAGCGGSSSTGGGGGISNTVYVTGQNTNTIFAFSENSSGALIPLSGAPTHGTGSVPISIAAHSSGKLVFVANNADGVITILSRNTGNGQLITPPLPPGALNPPPPIMAGTGPVAMVATPNGSFLYVLNNGSQDISAYSVDVTNNTLKLIMNGTSKTSFPVPVANPQFMVVSPDSKVLYVSNPAAGSITTFAINADGTLPGGTTTTVGSNPSFMLVDPQQRFLYVTNPAGNTVRVFSLSGGSLSTEVSGSPFAAGTTPVALAINPSGTFLLATNFGSNNVSAYNISNAGALSAVSGSPFATGVNPSFVVFDKSNSFVYVADQGSNDIAAYALSGTTLRALVGAPFPVGTGPTFISTGP
jgi:6-phosphogluconolactonase